MSDGGVLPEYRNKLMHDFWGAYDKLEHCEHLRCNAHLLRELKSCAEDGHQWAAELSGALITMKQARYQALREEKPPGKKGRVKQSREHNLLKRLKKKKAEIIAFLHDPSLPFDNNQAERDLRMMKVPQKVSGCFRSEDGAKMFCVIRSYLSTARKQGLSIIEAIRNALCGYPQPFAVGAE